MSSREVFTSSPSSPEEIKPSSSLILLMSSLSVVTLSVVAYPLRSSLIPSFFQVSRASRRSMMPPTSLPWAAPSIFSLSVLSSLLRLSTVLVSALNLAKSTKVGCSSFSTDSLKFSSAFRRAARSVMTCPLSSSAANTVSRLVFNVASSRVSVPTFSSRAAILEASSDWEICVWRSSILPFTSSILPSRSSF